MFNLMRPMFYLAPDEGGAGGGAAAPAGNEDAAKPDPNGGGEPAKPEPGKTYTQAELQAEIDRIAAKTRKEEKQKFEDERKKAAMTEAERLKAEKDDADKRAADADMRVNAIKIEAEAKVAAVTAGVKPENVGYVLKIADLSGVAVNDAGAVDEAAVKQAIDKVLSDVPALKAQAGAPAAGGEFGEGGQPPKNLDTQILEAETKGDWKRAGELKAIKAVNLQSKT